MFALLRALHSQETCLVSLATASLVFKETSAAPSASLVFKETSAAPSASLVLTLLRFATQETCHFVASLRLFSKKHRLRRALRLFSKETCLVSLATASLVLALLRALHSQETCHFVAPLRLFSKETCLVSLATASLVFKETSATPSASLVLTLLRFATQETCHFVASLRLFSKKHRLRRALRLF